MTDEPELDGITPEPKLPMDLPKSHGNSAIVEKLKKITGMDWAEKNKEANTLNGKRPVVEFETSLRTRNDVYKVAAILSRHGLQPQEEIHGEHAGISLTSENATKLVNDRLLPPPLTSELRAQGFQVSSYIG